MRDRGARGRSEVIDMQRTSRGKTNVKSRAYIVHRAPRRCCLESKKEGKKKEEEWRMLNIYEECIVMHEGAFGPNGGVIIIKQVAGPIWFLFGSMTASGLNLFDK